MADRDGFLAGGRLYYRAWDADGPRATVVIAHGYAEHSGRYEHVAERLVEAGCSAWAIDHRGHGQSEGERGNIGSIEAAAADLDRLVDQASATSPDVPVFLVGHSLGGAISMAYVAIHQERLAGLVLSGAVLRVAPEILALADLEEIPVLPLADVVSRDPAVVQAYKVDPLVHLGPPPRGFLNDMATAIPRIVARLPEITLPVLAMHGSADLLAPPAALSDIVAGVSATDVTTRLWPGLFHEIFNEPERDAVLDVVVGWITERDSAS
jgi:acylglycerol lipase